MDNNRHGLIVRKALLEDVGFSVQTASCGEEGLHLFKASPFDVVVTGFRMPGMDGNELIREIRQHSPNARIILLSGFIERLGLTDETTGANRVLEKNEREGANLVWSVRRLLGSRKPFASHPAASTGVPVQPTVGNSTKRAVDVRR